MSSICVLGIFVADISFSGNKIPTTGETILGDSYNIGPGGKGCNQAIAISRLGGQVNFISKLGNDDYGKLAVNKLKKDNIDTSNIIISNKHQTGVAGIHVDRNTGKNAITVVRGAPSSLTTEEIDANLIEFVFIDKMKNRVKILFDKNSLEFKGWITKDAYSNNVSFAIEDLKINNQIVDDFFKIPKEEDL